MAKLQRWRRRDPAVGTTATEAADDAGPTLDDEVTSAPEEPAEPVEPVVPVEPVDPAATTDDDVTTDSTDPTAVVPASERRPASRLRLSILDSSTVTLFLASHPRQALTTGLALGIAALAAERPPREAAVVALTGTVGQAILGWHNDIVDRERDRRHGTPRKPVADGRLEPGTVWYALVLGVLLVIPLSISTGVTAGTYYLGALAVGLLGNVVLRRGLFSWVPWAAQFALYAPYLSLGGWGGGADGDAPEPVMVVLFALLGVGVHVLRAIWGLVADDADGWTYLPLRLGRKLGATRLLLLAIAYCGVVLAVVAIVGGSVGLRR